MQHRGLLGVTLAGLLLVLMACIVVLIVQTNQQSYAITPTTATTYDAP